jgi:hypothetical protein
MLVHALIAVDSTTQVAFGHDITGVAFVFLVAGGTDKLDVFALGHFLTSPLAQNIQECIVTFVQASNLSISI